LKEATGVTFAHACGADNWPTAVASPTLASTALLTPAPAADSAAPARTIGDAAPAAAGDVAPVSAADDE
jgi:hypothetical protein